MWIVVTDIPYYPQVEVFEDLEDARRAFESPPPFQPGHRYLAEVSRMSWLSPDESQSIRG